MLSLSMTSCSTRDTSKKVSESALDVIDGISDALKDRGEESGQNVGDGLGEVGKGLTKSFGQLLTENADSLGKGVGEIVGKGGLGLLEGLKNTLLSTMEFENAKPTFAQVSDIGISEMEKNVLVIFSTDIIEEDNQVEVLCYDANNNQTQVLRGSFPSSSSICELVLTSNELEILKNAHRRVVSTKQIRTESAPAAE